MLVMALHKFNHGDDGVVMPGSIVEIDDGKNWPKVDPVILRSGLARRLTDGELFEHWSAQQEAKAEADPEPPKPKPKPRARTRTKK